MNRLLNDCSVLLLCKDSPELKPRLHEHQRVNTDQDEVGPQGHPEVCSLPSNNLIIILSSNRLKCYKSLAEASGKPWHFL